MGKHGSVSGRRSGLRTGAIALVLFVGTDAAALILARAFHLGVAPTLVALLLSGGAVPTLYLVWATYVSAQQDAFRRESLAEVADQLARLVARQWKQEAGIRRLNDPYPLPVRWVAADASVADSWDVQVTLATTGAGWPEPPPPGTWASGPEGLAGSGRDIADVLSRAPTGRLGVLGEPGSGKTMLMVGLVLDLLLPQRRASGGPVPVLISLASWNPTGPDFRQWLAERLTSSYPALAANAQPDIDEGTLAAALLEENLIWPILDGLDEIPEAIRGPAIAKINDGLRPGEKLVLTCRTDQYQEAVLSSVGPKVSLTGAAVVQVVPLGSDDISGYLCYPGRREAKERWRPVLDVLGTRTPLGEALTTPLMVGLARTIYNPRPGELAGNLPDPAELLNPGLPDRESIERHLFDAFIPAAYRGDRSCRWTTPQAESWLTFAARHLEVTVEGPNLAWWQLRQAVPEAVFGFVSRLTGGIPGACLTGLIAGLAVAIAAGRADGLAVGLSIAMAAWFDGQFERRRWLCVPLALTGGIVASVAGGVAGGVAVAIASGLAVTISLRGRDWFEISSGLAVSIFAGLIAGLVDGLAGLGKGLEAGLGAGATAGLILGLVGVLAGSSDRSGERFRTGLVIGIIGGLVVGLVVAFPGHLVVWVTFGFIILIFIFVGILASAIFGFADRPEAPIAGMRFGSHLGFFGGLFGRRPENLKAVLVMTRGAGTRALLAIAAGTAVGFGIDAVPGAGLLAGLLTGAGSALVAGSYALTNVPGHLAEAPSPRSVLMRDRQAALINFFWTGLGYGPIFGIAAGLVAGPIAGLIAGFTSGIAAGLRHSISETAWPTYIIARAWLALHRRLPWLLMGFLTDAHQRRGALRQDGAYYQFRHIELQRRLANRP